MIRYARPRVFVGSGSKHGSLSDDKLNARLAESRQWGGRAKGVWAQQATLHTCKGGRGVTLDSIAAV